MNDELRAEINRQKAISREMRDQGERLSQYLQSLHGSLDKSKAIAEQSLALKKQLAETESRIERLEQKSNQQAQAATSPTPTLQPKKEVETW